MIWIGDGYMFASVRTIGKDMIYAYSLVVDDGRRIGKRAMEWMESLAME